MPVQTINTINNHLHEDPQFREYILQSLANLGQRLGVKGDSITTKSFAFKELFDIDSRVSDEKYIGIIERKNGHIYFSIKDKETLKFSPAQEIAIPVSNNSVSISTEFELAIPINGVKSYATGGIITVNNNQYTLTFVGKDNRGKYKEFICDTFDSFTNELLFGLRVCELSEKPTIIFIRKLSTAFEISFYKIDDEKHGLETFLSNIHERLLTYREENINIKNITPEYWLNTGLASIIKMVDQKPDVIKVEIPINDMTYENMSLKLEYGNPEYQKVFELYPTVNTHLGYFIYDTRVFYPFVKEYYSESVYVSNDKEFKQQILVTLFNSIYNNVVRNNKLYVPVDYVFEYYCNSNNAWQIYGSVKDITVRYVNSPINIYNLPKYCNGSTLLGNLIGDNQVSIFDFSVDYDNNNDNIVTNISVEKKYTLPYINSNNVWVVDGLTTDILAKGRDAGNPNFVIIYNENKNLLNPQIICGANKENVLKKLSWEEKSVWIQPLEQINVDDPKIITEADLYKLSCKVPKISQYTSEQDIENFITPLKYAIIVNMSSINCLDKVDQPVIDRYGKYGIITTLWTLNERTNEFECVQNPYFENDIRNVALDINSLTNLNNIIKWHIQNAELKHPDKYRHQWLVFENALSDLKNNVNDYQTYVYPVIMNQKSIEFATEGYNNDFNMIIKYQDLVKDAEADDIDIVSNSNANKYLADTLTNTNTIQVTSSLYSYYGVDGNRKLYDEFIPDVNVPTLNLKEILLQNHNIENRSNVISFDRDGNMFYSYFGTSFDDDDKSITRIGSTTKNINIGNETLLMPNDEVFKKSSEFHLDFAKNYLNGYVEVKDNLQARQDVLIDHLEWTNKNVPTSGDYEAGEFKVNYTNYVPVSKLIIAEHISLPPAQEFDCSPLQFNNMNRYYDDNNGGDPFINNQIYNYYRAADFFINNVAENHLKLWVPCFYIFDQEITIPNKYLYLGEALYLPSLLGHLRLNDWATTEGLSRIKVTSNCKVVKYSGKPVMLLTSNRFIKDIKVKDVKQQNIDSFMAAYFEYAQNPTYIGNALDVTYYVSGNVLNITINETNNNAHKINNLFSLKTEY